MLSTIVAHPFPTCFWPLRGQGNERQAGNDEGGAQQAAAAGLLLQDEHAHQDAEDYPHLSGGGHVADLRQVEGGQHQPIRDEEQQPRRHDGPRVPSPLPPHGRQPIATQNVRCKSNGAPDRQQVHVEEGLDVLHPSLVHERVAGDGQPGEYGVSNATVSQQRRRSGEDLSKAAPPGDDVDADDD